MFEKYTFYNYHDLGCISNAPNGETEEKWQNLEQTMLTCMQTSNAFISV